MEFIGNVFSHAVSWVGLALTVLDIAEKIANKAIFLPRWALRWSAVVLLFVGCYQAWQDEHGKVLAQGTYLESHIVPSWTPPFPTNQPISMNSYWKNSGPFPAFYFKQMPMVYLRPDNSPSTQRELIKEFKSWAENQFANDEEEGIPLFPTREMYKTADGQRPITTQDVLDLSVGKQYLFVLTAARYQDGGGMHEAHSCNWLMPRGEYAANVTVQMNFPFCIAFNSPVDIKQPKQAKQ